MMVASIHKVARRQPRGVEPHGRRFERRQRKGSKRPDGARSGASRLVERHRARNRRAVRTAAAAPRSFTAPHARSPVRSRVARSAPSGSDRTAPREPCASGFDERALVAHRWGGRSSRCPLLAALSHSAGVDRSGALFRYAVQSRFDRPAGPGSRERRGAFRSTCSNTRRAVPELVCGGSGAGGSSGRGACFRPAEGARARFRQKTPKPVARVGAP